MDHLSLPANLQEVLIPSLPASGYYVPNFVTESEEAHLLQNVNVPEFGLSILLHWQLLTSSDQQCSLTKLEKALPSPSSSPPFAPLAH